MLVLVPARAEPATALEWGQLGEAPGQARVWDWAEHPARQPWVKVLVTSPLPRYSFAMVPVPSSISLTDGTAVDDVVQLEHGASIVHGAAEGDDVTIRVASCEFDIRATCLHAKTWS